MESNLIRKIGSFCTHKIHFKWAWVKLEVSLSGDLSLCVKLLLGFQWRTGRKKKMISKALQGNIFALLIGFMATVPQLLQATDVSKPYPLPCLTFSLDVFLQILYGNGEFLTGISVFKDHLIKSLVYLVHPLIYLGRGWGNKQFILLLEGDRPILQWEGRGSGQSWWPAQFMLQNLWLES